jgi:hypothetical protein
MPARSKASHAGHHAQLNSFKQLQKVLISLIGGLTVVSPLKA